MVRPSSSSPEKKAAPSPQNPEKELAEAERVEALEALIRATVRETTEELLLEHAQSESRGVRKEVIFLVDEYMYLTSVQPLRE